MATRLDLSMLQNLNRKLRTGLWQVPVQWKSLRRVPGWSYAPKSVARLNVPHQFLYPLIFERLPLLRLEGHRLGELAVQSTGSSSDNKSLTQRMVLRWWHLMKTKEEPNLVQAFERVKKEFTPHLQQYSDYLLKTRESSVARHSQLAVAKVAKDAMDIELGRPERYGEHLESLVNRALHRYPTDPQQYFSPNVSRKLIKMMNVHKLRARLQQKTQIVTEQLDSSTLGQRSAAIVAEAAQPNLTGQSAAATPLSPLGFNPKRPITAFPVDAEGEPLPSPELFYQVEREWATTINNGAVKASIGAAKDRRLTEFHRSIDEMYAEPDAKLADYLAYLLWTQIITLGAKSLQSWLPYTHYLNHRIFFHAYRLLHTGLRRSSVHLPASTPLMPKVRHYRMTPKTWTFQQSVTHQRLLVLIQNHLTVTPMHSYAEPDDAGKDDDDDTTTSRKRELPLPRFWQEVMDEKVRIQHPGESWYNSRIRETIRMETYDMEYARIEDELKRQWLAKRAAAHAEASAPPSPAPTTKQ